MKLEILTLCHSAHTTDAALSIVAASDRLYADKAPSKVPESALVFRLRFGPSEVGPHEVVVSLMDQDGKPITPKNSKRIEAKIPNDQCTCTYIGVISLKSVVFPRFGEYQVDLIVDGSVLGSQPFYFNQV
jgi:hypothetical protein